MNRDSAGRFAFKPEGVFIKGYPVLYDPLHHRAKANGYVRKHIVVAEMCLGRSLRDGEVVHHINENKLDCAPENLMVFQSQNDHMRYHWMLRKPENYRGVSLPIGIYCTNRKDVNND